MPDPKPQFVWCELMTSDVPSAAAFYRDVIGWRTRDAGMPGYSYEILSANESDVGGIMAMPEPVRAAGGRPCWTGYIVVPDVDAAASRLQQSGGHIHRPPDDIPGVGRFAVVSDPQGAGFTLFRPLAGQRPPEAGTTPGRVGWHELHAVEREAAFAFYADQFGWAKTEAVDMGPMGIYQMFATHGTTSVGGVMTKMSNMPQPMWLYYFNVDGVDAAVARLTGAGGHLLMGPQEVPGGRWVVQAADPHGAMFAMVSPSR